MKNIVRSACVFTLALSMSVLSTTGLFAQSEDIQALLGTWDVELTEMGMQMQFVFKMEEEKLTGELVFEMGSGIMEDIAFSDNKLTFFVSLDAGGQVVGVDVTATIDGDEMTGTMFTDMGEAEFTGTKRKDL